MANFNFSQAFQGRGLAVVPPGVADTSTGVKLTSGAMQALTQIPDVSMRTVQFAEIASRARMAQMEMDYRLKKMAVDERQHARTLDYNTRKLAVDALLDEKRLEVMTLGNKTRLMTANNEAAKLKMLQAEELRKSNLDEMVAKFGTVARGVFINTEDPLEGIANVLQAGTMPMIAGAMKDPKTIISQYHNFDAKQQDGVKQVFSGSMARIINRKRVIDWIEDLRKFPNRIENRSTQFSFSTDPNETPEQRQARLANIDIVDTGGIGPEGVQYLRDSGFLDSQIKSMDTIYQGWNRVYAGTEFDFTTNLTKNEFEEQIQVYRDNLEGIGEQLKILSDPANDLSDAQITSKADLSRAYDWNVKKILELQGRRSAPGQDYAGLDSQGTGQFGGIQQLGVQSQFSRGGTPGSVDPSQLVERLAPRVDTVRESRPERIQELTSMLAELEGEIQAADVLGDKPDTLTGKEKKIRDFGGGIGDPLSFDNINELKEERDQIQRELDEQVAIQDIENKRTRLIMELQDIATIDFKDLSPLQRRRLAAYVEKAQKFIESRSIEDYPDPKELNL